MCRKGAWELWFDVQKEEAEEAVAFDCNGLLF